MKNTNIIKQNNKDEIEKLKNRLYQNKSKRLEMIDGYIDKIKSELDTRDLQEIPTPLLTKMLISFVDLAKKEYPQIEIQHIEEQDDVDFQIESFRNYKTESIIF